MIAFLSLVVLLVSHDEHVSAVDDLAEAALGSQRLWQQQQHSDKRAER